MDNQLTEVYLKPINGKSSLYNSSVYRSSVNDSCCQSH